MAMAKNYRHKKNPLHLLQQEESVASLVLADLKGASASHCGNRRRYANQYF